MKYHWARHWLVIACIFFGTALLVPGGTAVGQDWDIITQKGPLSVVFSPDGKWIAAGTTSGSLTIWDATTGEVISTIHAHPGSVRGLAVAPNGAWLASGGSDEFIKLWDPATGNKVRELAGSTAEVQTLATNPDGALLAAGDNRGKLTVWETATGREVYSKADPVFGGFHLHPPLQTLAFSPDGKWIALGQSGVVKLKQAQRLDQPLDLDDRTMKLEPQFDVNALAFSPDGRLLAAAIHDGSILVTVAERLAPSLREMTEEGHRPTREKPRTLKQGASPMALAFSPDGAILASGGFNGVILWNTSNWKKARVRIKYKETVWGVAFSPNGKIIATAGNDQTIRLWDVETGKEHRSMPAP